MGVPRCRRHARIIFGVAANPDCGQRYCRCQFACFLALLMHSTQACKPFHCGYLVLNDSIIL